jgi:mannosyltransferase
LVLALAAVGAPGQLRYRDPASGHTEDVRGVLRVLTAQARPADAIVFVPDHLRIVTLMAPGLGLTAARMPDDVALARSPLASASLVGQDVPAAEIPGRMAARSRVWLVTRSGGAATASTDADRAKLGVLAAGYAEVSHRQVTVFAVTLFERRSAG